MSQIPADSPNENTNVIVNSMKKQRRSMRLPVVAGTLGLAGLVAIMMLGLGSRRSESYTLAGGSMDVAGRSKTGGPANHDAAFAPPSADAGNVEVHIQPAGQLWVDKENHGSAAVHHIKLEPGAHTLRVKRKDASISQTLVIAAKQDFVVHFDKKAAKVSRP